MNNLTHVSINNQTAFKRKGSNSTAIGALGVTVFRRQMQQVGCLVLLFHFGEFFTRVQVSCADISPSFSHLMLDIQQETSREDVVFQLKERDIDVAVATK